MNLGSSLIALGDKTGFELSMKNAVGIEPKLAEANFGLAEFYMVEDRLSPAWDHMQKASDISPSDQRHINCPGKILLQQGKASEAVPYFEKTLETAPVLTKPTIILVSCWPSREIIETLQYSFRRLWKLIRKIFRPRPTSRDLAI